MDNRACGNVEKFVFLRERCKIWGTDTEPGVEWDTAGMLYGSAVNGTAMHALTVTLGIFGHGGIP
jgi:hypothetical protein